MAIEIVDYKPQYLDDYCRLTEEWITKHWVMESRDYEELCEVQSMIDDGGYLLIALLDGKAVGTCAMIPMDGEKYDFELAKFCVSPCAQGLGLGSKLIRAALQRAKEMGKNRIYLETNHLCETAIHLYEKLGFSHLEGHSKVFDRGDVLMAVIL